jgi:hypothetical protein
VISRARLVSTSAAVRFPSRNVFKLITVPHHQISTNAAERHFAEPTPEAESHFRYLGFIASVIKQEQREELATQSRTEPPINLEIVLRLHPIAVHENGRLQIVTRMVEFGQQRVDG